MKSLMSDEELAFEPAFRAAAFNRAYFIAARFNRCYFIALMA